MILFTVIFRVQLLLIQQCNNKRCHHIISASAPEDIDYTLYDIYNALLIDTGAFTTKEALKRTT
jgi:hypothetical protein